MDFSEGNILHVKDYQFEKRKVVAKDGFYGEWMADDLKPDYSSLPACGTAGGRPLGRHRLRPVNIGQNGN